MKRTLEQVYGDPIFQALNPETRRFVEARWLPPELNPYLKPYGISIAAIIPFVGLAHIKTVPTLQMMLEDFKKGIYEGMHTIVVPSSGNTAHAVARLARAFGFKKVKVVMSSDIPDSKVGILKAFGDYIDVRQVGNVSGAALEESQKPWHYLLDQYNHLGNVRAHELYTGPEILRVLGPRLAVIAIAMGSTGTLTGVSRFLKRDGRQVFVIGAQPKLGEQVPGARDWKKIEAVVKIIPWRDSVDHICAVSRKDSFIATRRLWSAIEPQPGPSSGLAWAGLMQHLQGCTPEFLASEYRGKVVAFICPDDGRFYSAQMMAELDPDQGL